jgi:hypothetical protein
MDEAIKKHTIVERTIKSDIIRKNTLRRKLYSDIGKVFHWTRGLETVNNRRKRKRCAKNIERYIPQIAKNKKIVLDLINDLQVRIKNELNFSDSEVSELQKTYKKEYEEMLNARKVVLKAKQGSLSEAEIDKLAGKTIEEIVPQKDVTGDAEKKDVVIPKEYLLAKARKKLKKETKDVEKVNEELASEEKDKILFQNELKRMMLEKEILS